MNTNLYEKGLKVRREVFGDAYVDAALKNADDFSMPMQKLVTEFCWGEVWSRPGIDRKARSMLNLSMIAVLNRAEELKAHIRGAINNGVSKSEICEIFLQVAVYGGMPAGLGAFKVAKEVFKEMDI